MGIGPSPRLYMESTLRGRNFIPSRHLGISIVLALQLCHSFYFQVKSLPLYIYVIHFIFTKSLPLYFYDIPLIFCSIPLPFIYLFFLRSFILFVCVCIYIVSRHLNKQKDFLPPPSEMAFKPQIKHNMGMSHINGRTLITLWRSTHKAWKRLKSIKERHKKPFSNKPLQYFLHFILMSFKFLHFKF